MSKSDKELPKIGFGTWQLKPKDAVDAVYHAIELGYRFIDTAQAYKNEEAVGQGINRAIDDGLVAREDLIVATKVWIMKLWPYFVRKSTEKSLEKLKLDYVDLLYIHWPAPLFYSAKKTIPAFNELVEKRQIKYIGVSNFTPNLIEEAKAHSDRPIFANQVEHHPMLRQESLRAYLDEQDIYLVAYSPLARGKILDVNPIIEIARKHGVSEAQVSLAWIMEHGAIPIPKATSKEHIQDNWKSLNLKLDQEDLEKIDGMDREKRLLDPPVIAPDW